MKRIILLFGTLFLNTFMAYGQSVTITPNETTAQGVDAEVEIKKVKSNSFVGAQLTGFRSRVSGSNDAAVTNGQDLLTITSQGFTGLSGFQPGGSMTFEAAQNWTAAAIGTDFRLRLGEPSDGLVMRERFTVKGSGDVGLGNAEPDAKLDISNLSTNDDYPSVRLLQLNPEGFNRIKFENLSKNGNFVIASKIETDAKNSRLHLYAGGVGNVLSITGDGNIINNGYTSMGADAIDVPKIKMKKIRGVTGTGSVRSVAHGLDVRKIIAVDIFIEASGDPFYFTVSPSYIGTGSDPVSSQFSYSFDSTYIYIRHIGENLRGKFYRILITYED